MNRGKDDMVISKLLEESIRCVGCKGRIALQNDAYVCPTCGNRYAIRDDVLDMIDYTELRSVGHQDREVSHIASLDLRTQETVMPADWDLLWNVRDNRAERRMSKVLRHISSQGVHLDVGCGRGDGTVCIGKRKPAIGLEYGHTACVAARRWHENVIQADAAELPFEDEYFDTITCLDVLEHILEPEAAISEMTRVLKKGGTFILQTPTLECDRIKAIGRRIHQIFVMVYRVAFKPWRKQVKLVDGKPKESQQPIEILRPKSVIEGYISSSGYRVLHNCRKRYWSKYPWIRLFSYSEMWVLIRSE